MISKQVCGACEREMLAAAQRLITPAPPCAAAAAKTRAST
jgi:hypothetical protein